MFRFIIPTILIGLSVATFLTFTSPWYNEITELRAKSASYEEALTNSKSLETEREKLTTKYNNISVDNLSKIKKFLPDNVDNIRLILEIERIASPYGMVLKDVKYDAEKKKTEGASSTAPLSVQAGAATQELNKDYGVWTLGFSTSGTYTNLISFLKDIESNLRIVDVVSITFTSDSGSGLNPGLAQLYRYDFKIKTYWLKN